MMAITSSKKFLNFLTMVLIMVLTASKEAVAETNPFTAEQREYDQYRALWVSKKLQRYQFKYNNVEATNKIEQGYTLPWTITVDHTTGFTAVDATNKKIENVSLSAIDNFFYLIKDQLNAKTAQEISVGYDPTYGNPNVIYIVRSDNSKYNVDLTDLRVL